MMPRNRPKWGMCNPMTPVIITKLTPNQTKSLKSVKCQGPEVHAPNGR